MDALNNLMCIRLTFKEIKMLSVISAEFCKIKSVDIIELTSVRWMNHMFKGGLKTARGITTR